ncbi:MAG: hypothetical protein R2746_04965 [Acidimicrobiales bacterium]
MFESLDNLLGATKTATIATGILNVWKHGATDVGAWWPTVSEADRSRVLLGIGVSHGPFIGAEYQKPLAKVAGYLDELDALGDGAPRPTSAASPPSAPRCSSSPGRAPPGRARTS